jgi:hypothetical protein
MARPTKKLELREGDYTYLRSLIKRNYSGPPIILEANLLKTENF